MVLYGPCSILLQQENPVPGQEVISCDTSLHIPPSPERQGRGDSQGTILEPQLTSGVLAHSLKIVAVGEKLEWGGWRRLLCDSKEVYNAFISISLKKDLVSNITELFEVLKWWGHIKKHRLTESVFYFYREFYYSYCYPAQIINW